MSPSPLMALPLKTTSAIETVGLVTPLSQLTTAKKWHDDVHHRIAKKEIPFLSTTL